MTTSTFNAVSGINCRIYGENASYATTRSTAATTNTNCSVGQRLETTVYNIYRSALKFDTSSIPDTDVISQVNMKLSVTTDNSSTDFDVVIVKYNWSASDPLTLENKDTVYDGILAATPDDNIWRNTSGIAINTYYSSGNLNTAWVNKTGYTYYGLISQRDINNSAPTGYEYVHIDVTTNKPQLVVVHAEAALAGIKTISGIAIASVKTINSVAIANVKSIQGIT